MMFRLLTIFTLAIGFVSEAWADIPTPPAPTGQKYVTVYNEVRLGKEFDDYVFFIAHGRGPGAPRYEYKKVTLSTKSSTTMPLGGRYQYVSLLAVPKASADQIRSDGPSIPEPGPSSVQPTDLSKIAGLHSIGFGDTATVSIKHPAGSVTRKFTITGFDQKGGIEATVEREPADDEGKKKSESRAEAGPGKTRAEAEPTKTRSIVAGIALAFSFAVGGFLFVRKQRTRVVQTSD